MSRPAVSALRGDRPGGDWTPAGGGAAPEPVPLATPPRRDDRLLHAPAARAIGFLALALFGALHWMQMLEPAAGARAWYAVGASALVIGVLVGARPLAPLPRAVVAAAALLAGCALALLGAGVPDELLRPARLDELVAGIVRGLGALPGVRVPYRGLDEWLRVVMALGGTILPVAAAALAFWPRRRAIGFRVPALVLLITAYAVPAVALIHQAEFLRGAVLALLVLAFLRLERLRRREAPAAAAAGVAAAGLALALAPALDRVEPWWDYETWALSAGGSKSTTFAWDHDYGPLRWPRDGRELLRVRSPARAYWKADQLDLFDGRRWVRGDLNEGGRQAPGLLDAEIDPRNLRRWTRQIRVSVRNLRSETFVTAGMVQDIDMPRRYPIPTTRPGIFRPTRTLRRGDAYRARVYVPAPEPAELRRARVADHSPELMAFREVSVRALPELGEADPAAAGVHPPAETATVTFPGFRADPVTPRFDSAVPDPGEPVLAASDLARTWRLARRLRRGAPTPYDYVKRVERMFGERFAYAERPPETSGTIEGFLFDSRIGYCQQFSGAMALLLRMGGIPARIATGFSPGSFDEKTREYVVRDLDAHSWVEAWFDGIGWVPFDPTPTSAPPRSQARPDISVSAAIGDVRDIGTATVDPRRAAEDGGPPWLLIAGAAALLALILGAGRVVVRRRRQKAPKPAVLELDRALRRAGRPLPPAATLTALEARFERWPAAVSYLRAVRAQRYGTASRGPTLAERRGLRRALASGRGPVARLRAWWALPPRLRAR